MKCGLLALVVCLFFSACASSPQPEAPVAALGIEKKVLPSGGEYLAKELRGYEIMLNGEAPHVWLRYGARVVATQIATELEVGNFWEFVLGGSRRPVVGSPFDRVLSMALGQPLSLSATIRHGNPDAPRVDILSNWASLSPDDRPAEYKVLETELLIPVTTLYSDETRLASFIESDKDLRDRLSLFRSFYIRVDKYSVTFLFAGNEREYSQMLLDHEGGYIGYMNSVFETVAAIADEVRRLK